ncbi:hypothetical protein C8Q79DRAFT_897399 [Trametes meyenii]|nr:hypothetical protein C8Q79DRAFT_897399 [Trametes meyenii]
MQPPLRKQSSQLTVDIGAAQSHLHRPSMDSGYASSMASSTRLPADWMLSRMYENWKIADAATQRLGLDLRSLEECKSQLRDARKSAEADKKSSGTKRRPTLIPLFRKKSTPTLVHPVPALACPDPSSDSVPPSLAELEARLSALESRVAATRSAAERLDTCFDELRRVLDDGRPVSWRSSHSSGSSGSFYADSYKKARRTVSTREEAYLASKSTTKALQRACLAVQSAHHHYMKAMDLLDVVCSPKKSKWEAIVGDEQSRQETYREAAKWAEKAQICFNECIRSLQPQWDLLKRDEVEICEDLKETGLLQAVQLYNLMYGGKTLAMGITQQVQIMMQKQDAVFQRLTNFAVWVQSCTKHCEAVELETRESRDTARRQLVALWVQADEDTETYSLVAPGEHSHVFQPHHHPL